MDIIKRKGIDIHWWGESLLLVDHLTDFYTCTPVEALLIKYLEKSNNISNTVVAMSSDLGMDEDDIVSFIEVFLENFSRFFQKTSHTQSSKVHITGKEGMFYPLELHISLTNACRHHCVHCYKSAQQNGMHIDIEALKHFLDDMCGNTPYLTLSGGDPILHPYFIDLLGEYEDKFYISVLTSGYKVDESTFNSLKQAKLGVTISLYSSEAKKHDSFAGVKGSHESITNFLIAAKEHHIPVNVSTILTNDNHADIEQLIAYLEDLGVRSISVGRIASIGRASHGKLQDRTPDRNQFMREVSSLGDKFSSVDIWSEDTQFSNKLSTGFRCTAGTFIWAIYENGEIHPCATCSTPELKIGDIYCFDDTILHDRSMYENRIAKLPYLQLSQEHPCPFID